MVCRCLGVPQIEECIFQHWFLDLVISSLLYPLQGFRSPEMGLHLGVGCWQWKLLRVLRHPTSHWLHVKRGCILVKQVYYTTKSPQYVVGTSPMHHTHRHVFPCSTQHYVRRSSNYSLSFHKQTIKQRDYIHRHKCFGSVFDSFQSELLGKG